MKATNILGGHQVKYGIQYDDVDVQAAQPAHGSDVHWPPTAGRRRPAPRFRSFPDVGLGQIYRVTRANFNVSRDISADLRNFFAQDTWRVGERLTVNPGIRYEQEKMSGTIIKDFS